MMLKKLAAAITAATTAIIPFYADTLNVSTPMSVYAEGTSDRASIPDWIPTDFDSAVEFRNTYGATHIDNGLICIVYPDSANRDNYGYELRTAKGKGYKLKQEIYTNEYSETCFDVYVFQPYMEGDVTLTLVDTYVTPLTTAPSGYPANNPEPPAIAEYTFTVDQSLNITETDIFGWLPDSVKEFGEYEKMNGEVSVKENYVVFCTVTIEQFGDRWESESSNKNENIKPLMISDCTMQVRDMYCDGSIDQIYVYQAVKDGKEKISLTRTSSARPTPEEPKTYSLTADCVVLDDAQTILLSGDMRVTLADYDTGDPLTLPDGAMPTIWTDIRKSTPDGEIFLNMQPCGFKQNPAIVDLGRFFDDYDFSFGLSGNDLPEGYSLLDTEDGKAGYYNGTIVPENYMTVTKYDNGSADVVFRLKKEQSIPEKDTIRFKLVNSDNGKTLCLDDYGYPFGLSAAINYYLEGQALPYFISKEFSIDSNPYSLDLSSEVSSGLKFDKISRLDISLYAVPGSCNVITGGTPKTVYDNNSMDVIVPIRFTPTGDVNSDGNFSISDLVSLQKWLLGDPDITFADWKAADFFNDDKLDIFDLILMRKELVYHNSRAFIFPDEYVGYSTPIIVREDGLKLYLGPEESFDCIAAIPARTRLRELGYMKNEDNWLYTEYNGQNGWIKTVEEDGSTPTIYYEEVAAKPVIYLYPEEETDVHVELELTEAELSTTYPKYNNGWDVTASPDGSLTNKADGTHHKYLFWDAVNCRTRFDFSEGFCVAGSDTESFLREKLTYMGLTEEEMNEFIVYWLPRMEHNRYNLIAFQSDAYTNSAKLDITPTPDSMLRIFMAYVPLEDAVNVEPQQLETFERKGFTVVEWGGSEIVS
ncbi:dockerin type I repeat-containing protein [uncultured Ruminococcus sp.]|uniref:dockerin type I repeat-containing protein n=1 Tax=uncultured Ruminococcus sp. TaxID=165186 RepID=UPI0025FF190D|nr:dockerin type I repeat-containing protein [uncultured Ruminococcus sp.]